MKRALVLSLIATLTTAAASPKPRVFSAPGCPVTFEVPAGWSVTVISGNPEMEYPHSVCSLALMPAHWEQVLEESEFELNDLAIEIQVIDLPFEGAAEAMGLERRDGKWNLVGRARMPTEPFETSHARGVRGSWTYGVFRKDGVDGYQAPGEADIVLLSRDRLSVAATAYWDSPEHPVFDSVVTSLRLER